MKTKKELEEEMVASHSVAETNQLDQNKMDLFGLSKKWQYWNNKKIDQTVPDYVADATKAANSMDAKLNDEWSKSQNNSDTQDELEHGAVIVNRGGNYVGINPKTGKRDEIQLKFHGGDRQKGDVTAGDYHTHPYGKAEIANVLNNYDWDGQGSGPSGADFSALAYQKLTDGYFSIIESGTVRSIIVVTDAAAYKAAFKKESGPNVVDMGPTIDDEIQKVIADPVNAKDPVTGKKRNFADVYWDGLVKALGVIKKENGDKDIGLKLLKSKPGNKTEYDIVYS